MGFNIHCQSQPILEVDRWNAYGVSEALAENRGFDPGCNPFQILPDTPNEVRFRLANNTEKVYPLGLPLRNIRLNYTQLDVDEARKLDWVLRNARPISIGANFDKHTQWMSNFGGIGQELKGVAEVGYCDNAQVIRRDRDLADDEIDYVPHIQAGYNAMIGDKQDADGNWLPKIVPGMIGGAALFENGFRCNLAARRYSASAITTAQQLWPNNSGGGHTHTVVGSAVPTPMAIGSDYVDHIIIAPDSNGTPVWPSNRWVATADQTGLTGLTICISVLARGSGGMTIGWAEGSTEADYEDFTLTEDWQWFTLRGVVPTATGRVRLHGGNAAQNSAGYIETRALQIEEGSGPSASFMDYDAISGSPVTDCIHIPEAINPHGFTFVFWVKYRDDDDDKVLFCYYPDGTSDQMILTIRGTDLVLEDMAASTSETLDCFAGIADDTWVQIVMVRSPGLLTPHFNRTQLYVNGAEVDDYENATRNEVALGSDPHLYIGGDGGTSYAVADGGSLNIPMDSCRLDSRVWTAAEVLADYELRSDSGMQNFLQMVQGRYFKPSQSYTPVGPFTDMYGGSMDLREVDVRRQTVP